VAAECRNASTEERRCQANPAEKTEKKELQENVDAVAERRESLKGQESPILF